MCIIVVKPMDVAMPDTETLRRCFNFNSDGAGFMYADGKIVQIRKGFMTFAEFVEALDAEVPENERTETAIVMHFRIATHGKVQAGCCHPFPVTDEKAELMAASTKSRMGLAHNGVIQGRHTSDNWSDTMDFVADVVTPLMRMNPAFIYNSNAADLLEGACNSKLAIMEGSGEIMTVGQFYDVDGVKFSNTSYQRTVYGWSSYGSIWEDDDYDLRGWKEWSRPVKSTTTQNAAVNTAPFGDYDDDDEDMYDLIDALPWRACGSCLWNEECALTYPVCESEREADSLSADIASEEAERELIEMGHEDADVEFYNALVESNNLALSKKGFYVE